ncbi:MAG TPA: NAD-dependent epimerase/dehydratase family protein [Gaiellales bacterium]|jgi:nucleoside-diphosphate-sugar epimerase|nr:NAD-dependent epimerase/dehydratase family protein [Gaiellales bacterium]
MRVLLTGGTGYIGAAVAESLSGSGWDVLAIARNDAGAARLRSAGHEPVSANLHDPARLADLAAGADAVVHVAATQDRDMAEVDTAVTHAFLDALAGTGKPLLYTSGCWVYGSAPTGGLLDEDSPTDPVLVYAWRPPLEAELVAAAPEVRTVVIRPGMVYGRGGGPLNQFAAMAADGHPRHVGDGENHWTLVHVDDLAELYLLALESAPAGTLWNAMHGPPIRVRELAAAATAGGGFAGGPVAWPVDEAAAELGPAVAEALTRDHRISGERAHRLLGWDPTRRQPLDELQG